MCFKKMAKFFYSAHETYINAKDKYNNIAIVLASEKTFSQFLK